jgi:peptidoglycan/LPS O-acetylase OafA/YrhL
MAIAESIRTASPFQLVAPTAEARSRYGHLDALKVVLTVLVIARHAGQAYGPTAVAGRSSKPTAPPSWGRSSRSTPRSSWACSS